ncbi:methyltransferase domain-containing protein [Maribacter algicola]|uniref:Methyltransferase domain-containing protein n=1 Tax=Meishania litoralis TaxID=3434685 RepID=A0ACC7LGU5_9FLAO
MIEIEQNKKTQSVALNRLKNFLKNEQWSYAYFEQLETLLSFAASELRKGNISRNEIIELNQNLGKDFLENTLHGRGFLKPNGYPGDYLFLDRIYTNHISNNPNYGIWDMYLQQHAAPKAVRNRKDYFKGLVKDKAMGRCQINVLNVISGSGRELFELYNEGSTKNIYTTCVEIDKEAIEFSKNLNKDHIKNIEYTNTNIFRYETSNTYDLIWAAGLFDYLDDRAFVKLLKRFRRWQKKGGEIVIGNYNDDYNPSRDYMEVFGDWHLIHRTETQMRHLAEQAGFSTGVSVGRTPDNVILYLHLRA